MWLALFSAAIALVTVWVLPISLAVQVAATSLFALVPIAALIYWLGRLTEHRGRDDGPSR